MRAAIACVAVLGMSAGKAPHIPLVKDLAIMEAWHGPPSQGDYESSTRVDAVDAQSVSLTFVSKSQDLEIDTRMARATMRDARIYRQVWTSFDPEVIAGATSMTVSSAVLNDLVAKGAAKMTIIPRVGTGKTGSILGQMGSFAKVMLSDSTSPGTPYTGTFRRVEPAAVGFALLINGQPSSVAAIHARGMVFAESDSIDVDMYILDDPALPIVLSSGVVGGAAGGEGGRVIKITFPDTSLAAALEQQLASRKPAELYDIYFDYNEATITPQSDVALHTLGDIMRRHPEWKLDIVGHTDSVGGSGAGNLSLSARRATAVRDALTNRFGVGAARLTTRGAGGSQPMATNATLEGRAKNRRVEIRRL